MEYSTRPSLTVWRILRRLRKDRIYSVADAATMAVFDQARGDRPWGWVGGHER